MKSWEDMNNAERALERMIDRRLTDGPPANTARAQIYATLAVVDALNHIGMMIEVINNKIAHQ